VYTVNSLLSAVFRTEATFTTNMFTFVLSVACKAFYSMSKLCYSIFGIFIVVTNLHYPYASPSPVLETCASSWSAVGLVWFPGCSSRVSGRKSLESFANLRSRRNDFRMHRYFSPISFIFLTPGKKLSSAEDTVE
jgi:hypothetical protein